MTSRTLAAARRIGSDLGDRLRLALEALGVAIDLAEQAGADQRTVAVLRKIRVRLGTERAGGA
jgi:hypothetical protein